LQQHTGVLGDAEDKDKQRRIEFVLLCKFCPQQQPIGV
jgi:hypothetical protein